MNDNDNEQNQTQENQENQEQNSSQPAGVVPPSDIDPIHLDYANSLKKQLGDAYSEDLDKYDVKTRIEIMKNMVRVVPQKKKGNRHNSNIPQPKPQSNGPKPKPRPLKIKGIDWRKYRQE